jgi:hypothetical protein
VGRKLQVGDLVECRFFNRPDNKFYGQLWTGELVAISDERGFSTHVKPYIVERDSGLPSIALHRKEIRLIIGQAPERTMFQECWVEKLTDNGYYFNSEYAVNIMEEHGFEAIYESAHGCHRYTYGHFEMWECIHQWGGVSRMAWAVAERVKDGELFNHRYFTWQDEEGDAMQRAVEFIKGKVNAE